MKQLLIAMVLSAGIFTASEGQVNFYFLPELYAKSVDGLGTFQVQNLTGAAITGKVVILVKENTTRSGVVTITTPVTSFGAGINNFPRTSFANAVFNFSGSRLAALINQTRNFVPGEYTICFRFINSINHGDDYETCFDASIQPLVPINLLIPADHDHICEKRPSFSWQPPIPFQPSMRFRMLVTEKKQGEAVENLLMNAPLILLDNISSTTVSFPSFAADLTEGKTYCWQVVVYQQGLIVSKSDIWQFTVQCKEEQAPLGGDSYRELKLLQNGNYYISSRMLKFTFRNNYNIKKLNYTILDIEKGGEKIKNLPEVPLKPGINKIDIDISDLDLVPGKHYLLKVYPFNEPEAEVRFIYQETTNSK
ncbi:MAG TPA: hypothetical protein VLD19_13735 [Chitinophagaceae bacterium]|nr:hypothetical protein [Chitinophagaceae bacterium]